MNVQLLDGSGGVLASNPDAADRALTARLKQSLALLDVRVLDHLVVAGTSHVSMAARGWV